MRQYVTGLLPDGERKSIEPIAARLVDRPTDVRAMRQGLQQRVVVRPGTTEALVPESQLLDLEPRSSTRSRTATRVWHLPRMGVNRRGILTPLGG